MNAYLRVLSSHETSILNRDNVVGLGVGLKETGGQCTGRMAMIVLVSKKMPLSAMARGQAIPRQIDSLHTDVLEVGEIILLAKSRLEKSRPAQPGMSLGHIRVTAGTFGALVRDQATGAPLILSNNHVLANITDGRDGRARKGDAVIQPGRADGGTAEDQIAYLERFVPILRSNEAPRCRIARRAERVANRILGMIKPNYQLKLYRSSQGSNLVDAAVARPISEDLITDEILEIGRVLSVRDADLGEKVVKSGRTTGISGGQVKVIGATVKVSMGDIGTAVFRDQIVTTAMAQPGDSGSLLLSLRKEALGLVAAGSDRTTISCKIGHVMNLLNVTF